MSIKKNVAWNLFGAASPALVGLLALPFLLDQIGVDKLGVLTLVWALIGYFSIFDLGLGRALTHRISALQGVGDAQSIDGAISFGMGLMLLVGAFASLFICGIVYVFGIAWLNVGPDVYKQAYWSIFAASLGIPFTTLTSGLKGVLEGHENFKSINLLRMLLGTSNFLFPVISVELFGPNLLFIVLSLLIVRLLILLAHWYLVVSLLGRKIQYKLSMPDANSKKLLHFGVWMTLSNIVGPLMAVADRFFISHFNGSASVSYYSVPFDLIFRLLVLPASITTTLFPVFSKGLNQSGNEVKSKYIKCQLFIFCVMLPICLFMAIFSNFGLTLWMGSEFADQSYQVASLISIGLFFNSLGQAPLTLLQADGRVKLTAILHLLEFLIYTPILIWLILNYGIKGAASAWLIRVLIDSSFLNIAALKHVRFGHEQ
ncbi:flippase [Polynucleobacter paneuropaeus]|nr:flippase [Polynucleobacter paneuropaeus]MBT8532396.1 flippase [Polynucleobacter paneuropaeus]MBT8602610.1 flippase [Polynucleobacter paneuropaeus]MBT8624773.1 flippase [Polynucleobacter paneuropaeus]MBT8630116.1 flippase [Polynucleobacter paneuropaeus]